MDLKIFTLAIKTDHFFLLLLAFRDWFFAGLERVAEELMGRRKWALYQDALNTSTAVRQQQQQQQQQQEEEEGTALKSDTQLTEKSSATGAFIF